MNAALLSRLLHALCREHGRAIDVKPRTRAPNNPRDDFADVHADSHANIYPKVRVELA